MRNFRVSGVLPLSHFPVAGRPATGRRTAAVEMQKASRLFGQNADAITLTVVGAANRLSYQPDLGVGASWRSDMRSNSHRHRHRWQRPAKVRYEHQQRAWITGFISADALQRAEAFAGAAELGAVLATTKPIAAIAPIMIERTVSSFVSSRARTIVSRLAGLAVDRALRACARRFGPWQDYLAGVATRSTGGRSSPS